MNSSNIELNRIKLNNARASEVLPFLESIEFIPNSTILDLGTGTGWAADYFSSNRNLNVTALDMDLSAAVIDPKAIYIEANFFDYTPQERFDYVFASHFLEHFADPGNVVEKIKTLLKPNGKLVIIVPKYTPHSTNCHWHSGWNVGQLLNFFTNLGFDCRNSIFHKIGTSICGIAELSAEVSCNLQKESSLLQTMNYAPKSIAKFYVSEPEQLLWADLNYVDKNHAYKAGKIEVFNSETFTTLKNIPKQTHSLEEIWNEFTLSNNLVNLTPNTQITLGVFSEGPSETNLRLILGHKSNIDKDLFAIHVDYWFTVSRGINIIELTVMDFQQRIGSLDYSSEMTLSFGGPASKDSKISFNHAVSTNL